MNDKPQLIREKRIAATPELVELKFGCEVSAYIAGEDGDPMWADYETGVVLHECGIYSRHKKWSIHLYREGCQLHHAALPFTCSAVFAAITSPFRRTCSN
jgi:hypothetical protein